MNLEDFDGKKPKKLEVADDMFLTKIGLLVQSVTDSFVKYEYSKAKLETEQFFWSDFCNNYLEIVKKRVYQGKGDARKSAQYTLYQSLLAIVKMISPIMPFITEEIYQEHFKKYEKDKSIHLSSWPKVENVEQKKLDNLHKFGTLLDTIEDVRRWKTNKQKSMNSEIKLIVVGPVLKNLKDLLEDLKNVTHAKEVEQGKQFKVEFV
jgi:valyl-tRNA synthetase